jgi:RNA methyltransferase, TrmH family
VPPPPTITSAANPLVKRLRLLADRRHRRREGAFVVEGLQPVWRAVEAGWGIETLVVAPELLAATSAASMVAEREAAGVPVARLSTELFGRLSERDGPSGLAAIVRTRTRTLADVPAQGLVVALHGVGNPGNLGTVVRTADAAGADAVVLLGDTADPFAPAAVKASMGSLFALPIVHTADPDAFLSWAGTGGMRVVATSGSAEGAHWAADWTPPVALLLGSEGPGLPDELLERAHETVRIPMTGTAESLNLAVAAGILIYEARRGTWPDVPSATA